jgi:hypothetical protein
MAAALAALMADPAARRRLGAAGLRQVAAGWDLEAGVTRLLALLRPVLEAGSAAPAHPLRAPSPSRP